jgi:hypothetical protein
LIHSIHSFFPTLFHIHHSHHKMAAFPTNLARRVVTSRAFSSNRSFFASSTDHTTLLSTATAHRIGGDEDGYGKRDYILVPHDTPLDLAIKVDKIQLARLSANQNVIYGAKVVQRTLGTPTHVCGELLDMALKDASSKGETPTAVVSLQGLSKWVSRGIEGDNLINSLEEVKETDEGTFEAVKAIATGIPRPGHSVVGQGTYRDGKEAWSDIAKEYLNLGMSDEAELYRSKGATLVAIEHLADTSREGLTDAGGAMARFQFQA